MSYEVMINIKEYLNEDEIAGICKDYVLQRFALSNKEDLERIITNAAYHVVWKMVDEVVQENASKLLEDKVIEIINNLSEFNLFKKPNAWGRDENSTYSLLKSTVYNNSAVIEDRVKLGISKITDRQISEIVKEVMKDKVAKGLL